MAFCSVVGLSQAAADTPGACNPAVTAPQCAATSAPNVTVHVHTEPAKEQKCCPGFCCRLWAALQPSAPPTGIVVGSMPFLNAQLVTPTNAAPIQLTGGPLKYAPTPTGSKPNDRLGACSPESASNMNPGSGLGAAAPGSDQFSDKVDQLTRNVADLQGNIASLLKAQQEQLQIINELVRKKKSDGKGQ